MPPSKSCIPCRARKVKCDTASPICGPCRRSRANLECFYDPNSLGSHPLPLRRGEACLPCRRKKKRCDSTRPTCSTCARSRIHADCIYEDAPVDPPPADSITPADNESETLDTPSEVSDLGHTGELSSPATGNATFPPLTPPTPLKNFRPLLLTDHEDPLLYALSDISLEDLNMSFRLLFFTHRTQFGLYFPQSKQQAIIIGNTSGTVVHPFFIHFAQLAGCHFYQERRGEFFLLHLEAMYLDMVWDSFRDMTKEDDSFDAAQAYQLMALAYLYSQDSDRGRRFFQKSIALFRMHWIDFSISPPPDLTESLWERIAFLGEAIWTEIDCAFMFGIEQEFTSDLEFGLCNELPTAYPRVFESCILWLKPKTMMLARDVKTLLGSPIVSGDRAARLLSCQTLLSSLQAHLLSLNSGLEQRVLVNEDREAPASVRLCIIISLIKQAELYNDICRSSLPSTPERVQYRSSCRECLSEAATVTAELSPDDYYYLDPYLGVCCSRAINLLSEDLPDGFPPSLDPHTSVALSTQRSPPFTAELLDAQLSALRLARESVAMSVCLIPGGKSLCGQLAEYRRASGFHDLGRFTEV